MLVAALASAACAPRAPAVPSTHPLAVPFGLYKGRVEPASGKARRFRLLLFAALPDRLHGEVLSPVGSPQLILDGGSGRLAVTFVREGESFVGPADADALARVLGIRVGLDDLVRALLVGGTGDHGDYTAERRGEDVPGLPEALEIRTREATLSLELRRLHPLGTDAERLGRGVPPDGTEVRPLVDLAAAEGRLDGLGEGESGP